ncbi:MAG: family 20 glycosylhydrolase [Erysipelotrichaceae bacterium]|nr:family 20 glycosylhydrolase [Erysipelotrichaceae bacterium]
MFEYYLDYPYSMTSMKKLYDTIPHLGESNIVNDESLIGLEACVWSEHIDNNTTLEQRLFPRIYALAERGWSGFEYSD